MQKFNLGEKEEGKSESHDLKFVEDLQCIHVGEFCCELREFDINCL